MSKKSSDMENLARQLYRTHKQRLDLIKEHSSGSGFELAVQRLFGTNPERARALRVGSREFKFSSYAKNVVRFLPTQWQEELDRTQGTWRGCENWWARYPLIAWLEMRTGDDGITGWLKLNAEVGPISNHTIRKSMIEAIQAAASSRGLDRIQFPAYASEKGRLYSRFLQKNSVDVNDIRDADELERKLRSIIAGFEPEFELIASVLPGLVDLNDALVSR